MAKKQALRPAADPHHEGNSAAYHTGKPCIVKGCTEPAGTWWGPSWCMRHNDERLERISAALDNAEMTMRLRSMVNDATLDVRRYCAELIRQRDAAASIAWRRITKDDLVPHKEVLVTRGAGWTVRLLCWRSARPQRHNPALNYLEGWWEPGGCRVMDTDEPQWIAEIPPAPSVPTIGAADQAPRAPGASLPSAERSEDVNGQRQSCAPDARPNPPPWPR